MWYIISRSVDGTNFVYAGRDEITPPADALGCFRIYSDGMVEEWADGAWHELERVYDPTYAASLLEA